MELQSPSEGMMTARRLRMVDEQILRRGVRDELVLAAMRRVPRHLYLPEAWWDAAYDDSPQPIGYGQTISQPYIVGSMTEQLRLTPRSRVLEIGTGLGYQTAVLAEIAEEVYSIELIPELAEQAKLVLERQYSGKVHLRVGDGSVGWQEEAPFDGIIVTAAAESIPTSLVNQLGLNGRMIIPVRSETSELQELVLASRSSEGVTYEVLYAVRFVPLKSR